MTVERIRELDGFTGEAHLVKKDDKFFVVSGTTAMFTGWEVLVFPADAEGNVTNWGEVCGGRGISIQDAIDELDCLNLDELK